jgi:hypothetical protein
MLPLAVTCPIARTITRSSRRKLSSIWPSAAIVPLTS